MNGCFNWMMNQIFIQKIDVSPNIHFKLVVGGSRYIYIYTHRVRVVCLELALAFLGPFLGEAIPIATVTFRSGWEI